MKRTLFCILLIALTATACNASALTPLTMTSKVWVAVADGLPRKMESTTKAGVKTVVTYSDYNANIVIEPPIK